MSFAELLLLGVALSMDAFAVSVTNGAVFRSAYAGQEHREAFRLLSFAKAVSSADTANGTSVSEGRMAGSQNRSVRKRIFR